MAKFMGVLCLLLLGLLVSTSYQQSTSSNYSINCEEEDPHDVNVMRRAKLREMMKHAWSSYVQYAWGENELRPVSKRAHKSGIFGNSQLGATIVDGLSTLYIMGLTEQFQQGRDWVDKNLDVNNVIKDVSVFETTTRLVGGLLSSYALTGDIMFRDKAAQLAEKLLPAFETNTGVPHAIVNVNTGYGKNYGWVAGACSILSELGGLHLEFSYLSDVTENPVFRAKVDHIISVLQTMERPQGLYSNFINPNTGKWCQNHTSIGAMGDAFYEYLLKGWLQSDREDIKLRQMFDDAMVHIIHYLLRTSRGGLSYFGQLKYGRLEPAMDQTACFSGGLLGLAGWTLKNNMTIRYLEIAEAITNTCRESYQRTELKLGPQVFRFSDSVEAKAIKGFEKNYNLRPEIIDSYFNLWRITKDKKYRDWGWEIVQALEKECRVDGGYTGLTNVYGNNFSKDDDQQTFLLGGTLKYLYMLYSDDCLLPLDEWVFNTAGHPLPIKNMNALYREMV
ncbi:mannosyl-oligosaccharide alpha-1,2-mannosidase IA [Anabrus simplex]|uniref:mannosyl-oligosaccharide alpha-1,2-mannosidase IA n=1 Tax=Anabrus simplex TaxID=316456 RepID=UPI0035A36D85